jgi:hypothetical protein
MSSGVRQYAARKWGKVDLVRWGAMVSVSWFAMSRVVRRANRGLEHTQQCSTRAATQRRICCADWLLCYAAWMKAVERGARDCLKPENSSVRAKGFWRRQSRICGWESLLLQNSIFIDVFFPEYDDYLILRLLLTLLPRRLRSQRETFNLSSYL